MNYTSSNRIHDKAGGWSDSASQALETGMRSARDTVSTHPASAVFTAFAAGLGVGIGLALAFGRSPPPLEYGLREKFAQFLDEHMPWTRR